MSSTQITETTHGVLLTIRIIEAKFTSDVLKFGNFKPYVTVLIENIAWNSSAVAYQGSSAKWAETYSTDLLDLQDITFTVKCNRLFVKRREIGSVTIPAAALLSEKSISWWDLQLNGKHTGCIQIGILIDDTQSESSESKLTSAIRLSQLEVKYQIQTYKDKINRLKICRQEFRKNVNEVVRQSEGSDKLREQLLARIVEREEVTRKIENVRRERDEFRQKCKELKERGILKKLEERRGSVDLEIERVSGELKKLRGEKEAFLKEKQECYNLIENVYGSC